MKKAIRYGIIGCGGRLRYLARHLEKRDGAALKGSWDPSEINVRKLHRRLKRPDAVCYGSYQELVKDPDIDWVLVGSPNSFHKDHIAAAFGQGKHVFSEKPLATSVEDSLAIHEAHRKSGRLFATGFTLRYASIYRKAKQLLSKGTLGTIVSISAHENIRPDHGTYFMRFWRRHKEISGPFILEKCVHDMDLLNWFTDSVPLRIAAFGGNSMFIPENGHLYEKYKSSFGNWRAVPEEFETGEPNPFLTDKTIEDNVVAIMEYRSGVRVQFQAGMCSLIPERRMFFHCTGGTMVLELYAGTLKYKTFGQRFMRRFRFVGGGHGDGDRQIVRELHDSMMNGTPPVCGGDEGLRSSVVSLSIDKARRENRILNLEDVWDKLGV